MAFIAAAVFTSLFIVGGEASATVVRHDNGNTWTVGKGDVQSLFGWNAKTTDANFDKVVFEYQKVTTATGDCEYTVVTGDRNLKIRSSVTGTATVTKTMTRTLLVEVKRNGQGNIVGATVSNGGSSTEVDIQKACETKAESTLASDETIQGKVKATLATRVDTEAINVAAPISAQSDGSMKLLWTSSEKFENVTEEVIEVS